MSTGMMKSSRRGAIGLLLLLSLSAALLGPAGARATTGPTYVLPKAKFKVANKLATLYHGQYVLQHVAPGARLSGAAMGIETSERGNLFGVAQFYGYDQKGFQTSWVGTLYNFHPVRHGLMIIDVLAQAGRPLLARLYMYRAKNGNLSGQIQFVNPPKKFSISWRKITNK